MTQIVLPSNSNALGTAFGGQIAAWCDIAAAVAAQRFSRGPVVTASMDQLDFRAPVKTGMVVVLRAQVNQAWRTSMEIGVRVDAEEVQTGERTHCCSAYFTFVSLDFAGRPKPVPQVDLAGDRTAQRRAADADARRRARLALRTEREQLRRLHSEEESP